MTLIRKLKFNGRPVSTICGQMSFYDFPDFDVQVETSSKSKKELQKCECGAQAIGIQKFMPGHAEYCPVNEDKTPII